LTGGVRNVASHVGQALLGDQIVSANSAETWITLDPTADYASTVEAIRGVIDRYQGVRHTLLTYPQASLDQAPASNGKAITVRLYGTDPQALATHAEEIRQTLSYMPGISIDSATQTMTTEPSVRIQTDIPAAARYGLKPGDIRRQTAVLIAGIPVGSYYHDQQIFDVTVWSQPSIRQNVADVANLLISAPNGDRVPLKDIAQVSMLPAPAEIDHDRVSRFVDVTASVASGDLGKTVGQVSARMRSLQLPLGYHTEVFSDLRDQQGANRNLLLVVFGVLIGAFLLLQAAFKSWGRAFLLLLTLPLAAVGVLLAALATGAPLASSVLIGLVLVLGIALRNGIVLVRGFQRMENAAEDTTGADIVFVTTTETAGPVVITAVAIALAFLPFVVRGSIAGMEILFPLGAVVIGGLVTSTLLTLVIVPALYLQFFAQATTASVPQAQGEAR
jgi:Cu/Ag efflux pump CusA